MEHSAHEIVLTFVVALLLIAVAVLTALYRHWRGEAHRRQYWGGSQISREAVSAALKSASDRTGAFRPTNKDY